MRSADKQIADILVRYGEPFGGNVVAPTDLERFYSYTLPEPNSGCWIWTGGGDRYGAFWADGTYVLAHRFSYRAHKGPIPLGLQLDHTCRTTCCVNPDHLEAVTSVVNQNRKPFQNNQYKFRTHCKHGHLLAGDNLRMGRGGERVCRACNNARVIEFKRRKRHANG